jgi:hypothetical protein
MAHAGARLTPAGKTDDACQRRWQVTAPRTLLKQPRSLPGPSLVRDTGRNNGQPRIITDTDPAGHEPPWQLDRPPSCPYNDEVMALRVGDSGSTL